MFIARKKKNPVDAHPINVDDKKTTVHIVYEIHGIKCSF